MPKFLSIDRNGVFKSHNVEQGYPLLDLYRRVGFKSAESFDQQYVWNTAKYRIVVLAKTKGRTGQSNLHPLPFDNELDNKVFYGSIALLNIDEDGVYHDLDINSWNALLNTISPVETIMPKEPELKIEVKEMEETPVIEETQIENTHPEVKKAKRTRKVKAKIQESDQNENETPKEGPPTNQEDPASSQYVVELEEEDYNTTETIYDATIYNTLTVPVVQFRSNICAKLAEVIDQNSLNLEKGVYNYAIREAKFNSIVRKWDNPAFKQLYTDRMRTLYINLTTQPEFAARVKSGELDPETIAYMTHQEMNPARWKESIERKIKRDDSKFNAKVEASTDMFVCRNWKCKSTKCTYYEMQTRSADEPATVFITCLDCGKHWKM